MNEIKRQEGSRTMTAIDLFIKNVESFGYSLAELGFSGGASEEQIGEVEKSIKRILPEEFRLFLKKINGQYSDAFYFLPDQALLFSCEEIVDEYHSQSEYFEDTIEFYNEYQFKDKIRCTVWSESRIPIAGRDGYYLFLDFDPGPNGTVGQVIFLINECDFVVLSSSFKEFIRSYNCLIENGTFKVRKFVSGQNSTYRLTNGPDYLNGPDFAKLFGQ